MVAAAVALCVLGFLPGTAKERAFAGAPSFGDYIVVLKPGADREEAIKGARAAGGDVVMQYRQALNGFAVRLPAPALNGMSRNPNVLFVQEDSEVTLASSTLASTTFASSCDPTVVQCLPTGIDRIDVDRSSTRSGDGSGSVTVNVAVIDTGIDAAHPDLNVAGGVSCGGDDKLGGTVDVAGHGTEVAGVIGALDNGTGVVGVAPGARLWSVRVFAKNGKSSLSRMICGVDWVTSTRKDSDPANDIAVANMSLGFIPKQQPADDGNCGRSSKDALHLAICNSVAAGTTYVVAAGNSSMDFQTWTPATYDEVLTATSMVDFDGQPGSRVTSLEGTCVSPQNRPFTTDDSAGFFSNFATLPADEAHTLAAPGGCILTTASPGSAETPGPGLYASDFSGTSASVPHIAGTVALCIATGPCAGLTPPQIIAKIIGDAAAYSTTHSEYGFAGDPLHPIGGKYYGYLVAAGPY